jgi:peptide chain release factor subunit 1
MTLPLTERLKLKRFIAELASHKAAHTEFISVYVPQNYDLIKIIQHLAQEQGTASNIKSASTKKNVQAALEKMIHHLRTIGKTPLHGLAVFSGNIASKEGKQDLRIWSLEPPLPLKTRIYRCDKMFVTDLLEEMIIENQVYGLVVLDRRDAMLALLKGKTIIPLKKTHSEVPGKTRAGGQSAQRFARIREGAYKDHFKKIAEYMKEQFLPLGKDLKGIILGGPGTTVGGFLEKDYLTGDIKKKIIGTRDLSYTGEFGLQELIDKAQDLLAKEEIAEEKKIMQKLFDLLAKKPKKVAYGEKEVNKALKIGAVETLLLSEKLSEEEMIAFEELAKDTSAEVKLISVETREGQQLKDLGMVAAILRYELE